MVWIITYFEPRTPGGGKERSYVYYDEQAMRASLYQIISTALRVRNPNDTRLVVTLDNRFVGLREDTWLDTPALLRLARQITERDRHRRPKTTTTNDTVPNKKNRPFFLRLVRGAKICHEAPLQGILMTVSKKKRTEEEEGDDEAETGAEAGTGESEIEAEPEVTSEVEVEIEEETN